MTLYRIDRLVALAAAVACFAVMVVGWGMRGDAGVFPLISGGLGILACGWLATTSRRVARRVAETVAEKGEQPTPFDRQRMGLWCLSLLALLALMESLGTFIVVPLFLLFNLKVLARLNWGAALLLAGGFTLTLYVVFAYLLAVPLPAGLLAG